ncbi:MAG TPA: hypothetical protein P5128_01470 [Candidatus Sumerlaeia bacterium]|nr:hypothetical protein [Candidatus Sumerlaeia bacterium]
MDVSTLVDNAAELPSRFNSLSWAVVAAYVLFTTWFGHAMSGKQATIRDFFLGGRKLPWWAVSGSIIATEISAMTLVGVPAFLWATTGNMAYMVLGIGTIVGRILVAFLFVPAYYEQEIYSPYEYIGNKLGARARKMTSYLFMIGGALGQGTRVLLTAMVFRVLLGDTFPAWMGESGAIHASIWFVGVFAVLWTFMGGIVTVIWTDVVQFLIFVFSALVTLAVVIITLGQQGISIGTMVNTAYEAGKLHWLNWDFDLSMNYTFWAAIIASSLGSLGAYGTDQLMVQRAFCCKNEKDARKALIWSSVSQVIMIICLFVGVGLWYFYQKANIPNVGPAELHPIEVSNNNVLPVFIKYRVHPLIGGFIVAGIFAAAISSLEGILSALAEQSISSLRAAGKLKGTDADHIRQSRFFVCIWGVVLCAMASGFWEVWQGKGLIIELALSVVGLTAGGILGTFILALNPKLRRGSRALPWAATLSVMTVLAVAQHTQWALSVLILLSMAMMVIAALVFGEESKGIILRIIPFLIFIFFLNLYTNKEGAHLTIGWPWFSVLGMSIMILAGVILQSGKIAETDPDAQLGRG